MRIASHHLPGLTERQELHELPVRVEPTAAADVHVEHAMLTPVLLGRTLGAVAAARREGLLLRSVDDLIATIAALATDWQRDDFPWRALALRVLPATTRLSPAMVRAALPGLFAGYAAPHLHAFVESETVPGGGRALDGVVSTPVGGRLAVGPDLVAHVSAGNVPGLAIPTLFAGLLAKAAVVIKAPAGEPTLPALVARSLAERDPVLGACVAVAYWPGGIRELDEVLLGTADVVVVEGDDPTVEAVRARARGRVLGFGRRLSIAVATREALGDLPRLARNAAAAVSLYDQHGCLSPQALYVETGGAVPPVEVARALAVALEDLATELPSHALTPAEHAAVRDLRDQAEWRRIGGEDVRIFGDTPGAAATVVYEDGPRFAPTCGNRTVRVKPLQSIGELADHLGAWARHLEAVGVAGPPRRMREIALALARHSTVSRVCGLSAMQRPPFAWHRGGLGRLASMLRWIDVEAEVGGGAEPEPEATPQGPRDRAREPR